MKIEYSNEQLSKAVNELQISGQSKRAIVKALRYRRKTTLLSSVGLLVGVQFFLMAPMLAKSVENTPVKSFLMFSIPVTSVLFIIYGLSTLRDSANARAFTELIMKKNDQGET